MLSHDTQPKCPQGRLPCPFTYHAESFHSLCQAQTHNGGQNTAAVACYKKECSHQEELCNQTEALF